MNFYKKKGGNLVIDHKRAHFGGKTYRYSAMLFNDDIANFDDL